MPTAEDAFDVVSEGDPFFTNAMQRVENASLAEVARGIRTEMDVPSARLKACFANKTHETSAIERPTNACRKPPP